VEWLGEVPEGWEVKKITWLYGIGSGTTPTSDNTSYYDGEIPWITTGELRENIIVDSEKKVTQIAVDEHPSLRIYPKGSLVIAMYGATIGRLGILGVESTVNQACCVFSRPNGIDTWFAFYWFQMRRPYLISLGYGGGQPNLSQELLRSLRIPLPPPPEQHAIAAFLDHKTAEIDALIAAKERLIALLREKRAALITSAVTGKLEVGRMKDEGGNSSLIPPPSSLLPHPSSLLPPPSSLPMKDSGVEWLGEVPEHWEVRSLRRILTRRRIKNGSAERPMLSLSAYRGIVFKEYDDEALVRPTEENSDYVVVKPGQLVVNPMWVINSSIGVSTISGIVSPAYRVYDVSSDVFGLFLHNLTKSLPYISQYNRYIRGLTTYDRSVREDDFLNIEALIPPLPEQHAITAFLDRQTAGIDALVGKVEDAIDRLKEYRTALISAAVTGKIDVREEG